MSAEKKKGQRRGRASDSQVCLQIQQQLNRIEKRCAHMVGELDKIMSAISDFAAKQTDHNAKMDTAIQGLSGDIQSLKDLIAQLQNSPGQITPEDQATLDALEKQAGTTADKLQALDDLTPPTPPATP
jgi:hypothetical protein